MSLAMPETATATHDVTRYAVGARVFRMGSYLPAVVIVNDSAGIVLRYTDGAMRDRTAHYAHDEIGDYVTTYTPRIPRRR